MRTASFYRGAILVHYDPETKSATCENFLQEADAFDNELIRWNAIVDAIESFLLALACQDVDIDCSLIQVAVETVIDQALNSTD